MKQGPRYRSFLFAALIMVALVRAYDGPQELPGLVVAEILTDSAAAKAGFKVGDRVLSYDGKPLPSPAALQAAEENTVGKKEVALGVRRGDETLFLLAPAGRLGIQARPELPPDVLTLYEEGQHQGVQTQIRAKSPRYAALTQPQPLGLSEIQEQVLDKDTLLLEYVLGEEGSYLFAVTPASISSFELPKRAEIEQAARRVYELLLARQPVRGETPSQRQSRIDKADAGYPAAAAALSQVVLGPVAGMHSDQRLLIVADGAQ